MRTILLNSMNMVMVRSVGSRPSPWSQIPMSKTAMNAALDVLRHLAWMASAGLFVYGQIELMCLAVVAAIGLGH